MNNEKHITDFKQILLKHQNLIAVKYKLGKTLVTGHRKTYFDEAAIEAIKEITNETNESSN